MTVTWMLCTLAAGLLLTGAAAAAERIAGWFALPRRWAWAAAMAASLLLPALALAWRGALQPPRLAWQLADAPAPAAAPTEGEAAPAGGWMDAVPVPAPRRVPAPVLAGWAAASLAMLAALAAARRRLRRSCGALQPAVVDGTAVLVAARAGPMVLGVMEPRIVLPRWALDGRADELRLIVAHEREHVRAGDAWLLALSALAVAAVPWNPGLWWQHRRLRLAVETDCDARVLAAGASAERYGRVLLRTAGREGFLAAGAPAWGGRRSHLERRILAMTQSAPRHRAAMALPLAGIALLLAAGACGAASRGAPDAAVPEGPRLETFDGRLVRTEPVGGGEMVAVVGPVPGSGTIGLAWRYGSEPRTRNSPPPTVLPTVSYVAPGSPAETAGLRVGDVIALVNGSDARRPYLLADRKPGTAYTVRFRRGGAERETRLVVGPPPSRAEAERHMEMESACMRGALRGPAAGRDVRASECTFPY